MNSMKRTPTPCSRPKRGEVDDLVVVDAPHHHAVDLHRVEPGVDRGVDAGEHPVELVAPGELEEDLGAQRVERHVDAPQAGLRRGRGPSPASFTPLVVIAMSTPRGASMRDRAAAGAPAQWARRR